MDRPAYALKCSLTMTAVLIFTCALTSQVSGRPPSRAIKRAIRQMREEIQTSLSHLSRVSCPNRNLTELAGLKEQPPSNHTLSLFRCYMVEVSNVTVELETQLLGISQRSQDVENLMAGSISASSCSLPDFQQDKDKYQFVRCLLELLDKVLSHIQP